jgi:hypothetical protein
MLLAGRLGMLIFASDSLALMLQEARVGMLLL